MRVLLVSDLHYDLRKLDWVLTQAADVDLLVVAGDLLDIASGVPLDAQIVVVLEYLARFADRTTTVVCSGNHDLDHRTESEEKATRWILDARASGVVVDGDSITVGGWLDQLVRVVGGPGDAGRDGGRPGSRRRAAGRTVALGVPRTARGPVGVDRCAPLRRPGAPPAARAAPTRHRPVRPHPPGAVRGRRRLGRAAGHHVAVQRRPPARADALPRVPRPRRAHGGVVVVRGRRRGVAGQSRVTCRQPAGVASSRASGRSRARCRRAGGTRAGSAPSRTR